MPFEAFDYFVLQLFIQALAMSTAFLVLFNVTLALYGWIRAITKMK